MAKPDKKVKTRLLVLLAFFTIIIVILSGRVFWLQTVKGEDFQKAAFFQQSKSQTLSSNRGAIYDRNGNELAMNVPVVTVSVNPKQIQGAKVVGGEQISQFLSEILKMDKDEITKKLQQSNSYQVIKKKVDKETGDAIKKWMEDNKAIGVYLENDTKRYYPGNNLAAQVIGFTGNDNQGLAGIEMKMEEYLKGVPGISFDEVDAKRNLTPFSDGMRIDAQDGYNVVLTIDEHIQGIAEKALQKAIEEYGVLKGATAIVTDPRNGEILAMVSKPDYDLNTPFAVPVGANEIDTADWKSKSSEEQVKDLQKSVWRNRAVDSTYEPGSTFKAITAAAGMEEGIVNAETEVFDAPIVVAGWPIYCTYKPGHGKESFREAVYHSCNPVFVKLSQSLGLDRFYNYVRAFGFYEKTGIDLPGEADSIIHAKPREIDMAVASFGQSLNVTPIQMITSYSAIANGGKLVKPHIVKELTDSKGNVVKKIEPEVTRNVISRKTSDMLRDIMEGVVTNGTGTAAYVKGYRVAGKTGTSQTVENGVRSEERYIASFAAVAPADNPVISVLVVLDQPSINSHSGGVVAGPVAAHIIEQTLEYLGVERRYTEKEMTSQEISVPDLKYKTVAEAEKILTDLGFGYKILGSGSKTSGVIDRQVPKPNEPLSKVSTIMLYTSKNDKESMVKVPNVVGKGIPEATKELIDSGLNIRVRGVGAAVKQSVTQDTEVSMGTIVEVEFR